MYFFLIPLLLGFTFNLASAFTTAFSLRWGERRGSMISMILRDVFGIPVWAIGIILAVRTKSSELFSATNGTNAAGWLLLIGGGIIIILALTTIGTRAAKPLLRDTLVNYGIYAHIRHPIHSGVLLEFIGIFLMVPTITVALACLIGIHWVLAQTKLEEIDLLQRLPAYQDYMKSVPRFFPFLRRNKINIR